MPATFPYEISFEQPQFLLLLLFAPLIWITARGGRLAFDPLRWWVATTIRAGVFVLFVLAIAGFQWVRRTDDVTVVYLVDRSLSIPRGTVDAAVEFVNASIAEHRRQGRGDRAGVISFGKEAAVEIPPIAEPFRLAPQFETSLVLEETDLAAALRLARSVMAHQSARRVVILSDGNATRGDAAAVAAELADAGIGIDVVALASEPRADVAVEKVVIASEVRKGAPFEIRVSLAQQSPHSQSGEAPASDAPVSGELVILRHDQDDRQVIARERVSLTSATHYLTLRDQLEAPGFYSYEAEFHPDDPRTDGFVENNVARAFTQIRGAGRVLMIQDIYNSDEFAGLVELLERERIEVTVRRTDQLFADLSELQAFDLVILADVPRSNGDQLGSVQYFTDAHIDMLVQNTQQLGCGLMMIGGPNSFGPGGWSGTALEEAMPVNFHIKNLKVEASGALLLLIDSSGSMEGDKIQLSKAAAIAATRALKAKDYIGVYAFDTAVHQIVPLQEVKDPNHIVPMISKLTAGGGTHMEPGMQQGFRALANSPASTKHMVILSDGQTQPGAYQSLARQMRAQGITVTSVAIGPDADAALLDQIAVVGGGKFYQVNSPRAIPQIFMREARRVSRPLIYENPNGISLDVTSSHEAIKGLDASWPPVTGYVMTSIKDSPLTQVPVLAALPAGQPNPILATWQFGLGRSVALTTDIGQRWADAWREWPQREKLFVQLTRWAMRPADQSDQIIVDATVEDDQIKLVMNALDAEDQFMNFLTPRVAVAGPHGQSAHTTLTQAGPGRYVGSLPALDRGSYFISIHPGPESEIVRLGIDHNRAEEFQQRSDNLELLSGLAALAPEDGAAGNLIFLPSSAERSQNRSRGEASGESEAWDAFRGGLRTGADVRPVWHALVLLGCIAFFTDVLNRRVHWRPWQRSRSVAGDRQVAAADAASRAALERLKRRGEAVPRFELGEPSPAARERSVPANAASAAGGGEDSASESYTERLLRAKAQSQRSQAMRYGDRGGKTP